MNNKEVIIKSRIRSIITESSLALEVKIERLWALLQGQPERKEQEVKE